MLLKELKVIINKSRKLIKENGNIFDITLIGSSIKGKSKPSDIDLIIIFKRKIPQKDIEIALNKIRSSNIHAGYVFFEDLYKESIWQTIIHEGISLKNNKKISNLLGFKSSIIFSYNLKKMKPADKSRFSHSLYGRKKTEGLLFEVKGEELGRGCFSVPVEKSEEIYDFFKKWSIDFKVKKSLIV